MMLKKHEPIFVNYDVKAREEKKKIQANANSALYGDGIRGKKYKMFDLLGE